MGSGSAVGQGRTPEPSARFATAPRLGLNWPLAGSRSPGLAGPWGRSGLPVGAACQAGPCSVPMRWGLALTDGLHGDIEQPEAGAQRVHLGDVQPVGAPELTLVHAAGVRVPGVLHARPHLAGLGPADESTGQSVPGCRATAVLRAEKLSPTQQTQPGRGAKAPDPWPPSATQLRPWPGRSFSAGWDRV